MQRSGGCQCGAVRYQISGDALYVALCHCRDCQRSAGAPNVVWAAFNEAQFAVIAGDAKTVNLTGDSFRSFCSDCGTGLYFRNQTVLPGLVDVQAVTFDDPSAFPPGAHIQYAERQRWMDGADALHKFERYPPG